MTTSLTPHWVFRIAVAACFIGHGAFGIIQIPSEGPE